jgi:hypothetical protein
MAPSSRTAWAPCLLDPKCPALNNEIALEARTFVRDALTARGFADPVNRPDGFYASAQERLIL